MLIASTWREAERTHSAPFSYDKHDKGTAEGLSAQSKQEVCRWRPTAPHFHSQTPYSPQKGNKFSSEQINLNKLGANTKTAWRLQAQREPSYETPPASNTKHNVLHGTFSENKSS